MNTKVVIQIESNQNSAKVTQHAADSRVITKHIPLEDLPELIRVSSTTIVKDSDTGFISPNLIREVSAHGQIKRLYHFPVIKFNCHLRYYDDMSFNESNKYGIKYEDDHLVFTDFIYRNFGLLTVNVNAENFNCVRHNFGCLSTDFFDRVTDDSNLHFALLNHFDQKVCWHGSFDTSLLSERDSVKQARLVHNYLNSNFNNDLYLRCIPSYTAITKYANEGLSEFLDDVFSLTIEDISDSDERSYVVNVAILYFLCTKLNLKFEDVTEPSHHNESDSYLSIKDYF